MAEARLSLGGAIDFIVRLCRCVLEGSKNSRRGGLSTMLEREWRIKRVVMMKRTDLLKRGIFNHDTDVFWQYRGRNFAVLVPYLYGFRANHRYGGL